MNPVRLPPNSRVLVVVLRRLGDVLLTTPLIRSIKAAYPQTSIDALVFAGTEGILAGNPDLREVIAIPQRPHFGKTLSLIARLFRRYDLALSVQTGDRPTALAVIAGRQTAGLVEPGGSASAVKRLVLSRACVSDRHRHRVTDILSLAELLGIPVHAEIVCSAGTARSPLAPVPPYAVVHAAPMFVYKRWTGEGWRTLAAALRGRGLAIAVTGAAGDRAYLNDVWRNADVLRLDGKLTWPELSALLAGASVYIGPDTAVTHLAAGTGTPTVALYGPTDPRLWGPWPFGGLDRPWDAAGTIQRRRNVWLVQNPLPCLPCQLEGCERRIDSYSQCLDELTVEQVLSAVDQASKHDRAEWTPVFRSDRFQTTTS
jgi:lipopolysaccharide heptosyltransferase III